MDKNLSISHNPLVTVMMPVRNGEKYIRKAVESILFQTFTDFELLIIDGGSVDQTLNIVRSYKDKRIRLIQNDKSLNLAQARQKAVFLSRGKYIAYLDSDDIAMSSRLAVQMQFFHKNSDISAVGSWVEVIDSHGEKTGKVWKHASDFRYIPIILLFRNCLTQSTILIKKNCFKEFSYRKEYWAAPDYDLWSRMACKYKIGNIPEVLASYRLHNNSMSKLIKKDLCECTKKIIKNSLNNIGINPTAKDLNIHLMLEPGLNKYSNEDIENIRLWLVRLLEANRSAKIFDENIFGPLLNNYWFKINMINADYGYNSYLRYKKGLIYKLSTKHKINTLLILQLFSLLKIKRNVDVTSYDWLHFIM